MAGQNIMKNKVGLFLSGLLFLTSTIFADTIVLTKNKATYIQEEEFMLAEGENILGPVELHPLNTLEILNFEIENAEVVDYIYEPSSLNWKENLIGKEIVISGDSRVFKGKVIEIKKDFITLDTKKGVIIVPTPTFPSKIEIKKSYSSSASPKITFKIISKTSGESKIKISYPIKGIFWKVRYLQNNRKLVAFLVIENNTAFSFTSVDIFVKPLNKKLEKVFLPANSKKIIKFDIKNEKLPDGIVFIYGNGIFKGIGKVKSGKLIK